jgi:hypothetical protein
VEQEGVDLGWFRLELVAIPEKNIQFQPANPQRSVSRSLEIED